MAKHSFADSGGDLRKYFAAIPNIVLTLGLNPYELALYTHFKQAAGDDGGVCWKSRATISRESGMSAGMVTKARLTLEKPRPEIGNRPLITVKEEPSKTGGHPTCAVTITDIWPINMAKFATSHHDGATSHHDVEIGAPSPHDQQRHHTTLATSPHAPKEKPKKKNPEEEEQASPHSRLLKIHFDRLGKENVPDPQAQAGAVKWIVTRFPVEKAIECYQSQLREAWRKGHVSWLTVKQRIAEFAQPAPAQHEEIVEDCGDHYYVRACNGDGVSRRYRTAEAFARFTGRDLETVRAGWN